jgi:hypothetical protein
MWKTRRDENVPAPAIPERPPTMYELYKWFKAIGMLEYFFANICRDPAALVP